MKEIFKSYDVRGLYPSEISEELVEKIGRATVKFLNAKKIAIASDMRVSSPSLFSALKKGIMDEGADVIDLGLLSTPMLYFASSKLDIDGAIMVTASHNPPQYNGLKICKKNAVPIGITSGLSEIRDIALSEMLPASNISGQMSQHDIKPEYYDMISSFADLGNKIFRVATDSAHAMGVLELPVFKKIPGIINCGDLYSTLELPGVCPHEANPSKTETLIELQEAVRKDKVDIGIAFDGDADRIAFIDDLGRIVPSDLITALLGMALLSRYPDMTTLYDLRSSRSVKESIEKMGGIAHECMVGHSNIKLQMIREGAFFAGEASGHYYFSLVGYIAEMGSLPAVLLFNLMAQTGKKLSQLVDEVQIYSHSGEINFAVKSVASVLEHAKKKYSDGTFSLLDGVKIVYPDWWFLLRASANEPLIRLNLEANTQELMEEKREELIAMINSKSE